MLSCEERALRSALMHVTGRTQAFLLELDAAEGELRQLDDETAWKLAEAVAAVTRRPGMVGTLTYIVDLGTEALRKGGAQPGG